MLTEGLKAANQATKTQAKDLAATKAELKAELQEISARCSVLDSELRTVSVAQAGPDRTTVQEMVVREVTFQCTEHRRTQSRGPGLARRRHGLWGPIWAPSPLKTLGGFILPFTLVRTSRAVAFRRLLTFGFSSRVTPLC